MLDGRCAKARVFVPFGDMTGDGPDQAARWFGQGLSRWRQPARGRRGDRQAAGGRGGRGGGRRHRSSTSIGRSKTATAAPIEMRILTPRDREALDVLRHSTAHIMARAIMRLFPGVRLAFGPTTANGLLLRRRRARTQPLRGRLPRHRGRDGPDPQGCRAVRAVHACRWPRPASSSPTWARPSRSSTSTTSCTSTAS